MSAAGALPATPLSAREDAATPPLTRREKLSYGLGEAGDGIKTTALQTFLLFYYVQVVGMLGSLCGLALFLALLIDGATDPVVGSWSDNVRSRLGRRHPFLYIAPFPLAISLYLLFNPPAAMSQAGLFAWVLAFSLISRVAMSLYYVPHMALGAELSDRYDERIALSMARMLFTQVGRLVCLGAAFLIFFTPTPEHPNGQLNGAAYQGFSLFNGLVVVAFVLLSALGTQKRVLLYGRMRSADPIGGLSARAIGDRFGKALGIINFRRCFLALLVMYLFAGTQTVLVVHLNTYFWGLTPQQAQFTFYAQIFGFVAGLPLGPPMARLLDKKWSYCLCVGGSCVLVSIPVLLRLVGWFPPNGDPAVVISVALANLAYGVMGANSGVFSAAMLADVADQYDLKYRARAEGLFFGAVAFSSKASIGLGGAVAGVLLDVIAFPRGPDGGAPSAAAVTHLGVVYGPVLLLLLLLGLSIMFGYDLTRDKHAAILRQLEERRAPGGGASTVTS